jgi:hypothetical protein
MGGASRTRHASSIGGVAQNIGTTSCSRLSDSSHTSAGSPLCIRANTSTIDTNSVSAACSGASLSIGSF